MRVLFYINLPEVRNIVITQCLNAKVGREELEISNDSLVCLCNHVIFHFVLCYRCCSVVAAAAAMQQLRAVIEDDIITCCCYCLLLLVKTASGAAIWRHG